MNAKTLKLLLAGEYICSVRYRLEFEQLNETAEREEVDAWLSALGMRLGRVGDEGAFFLAYDYISPKEITQVKNELLKFRDEYGPAVRMLDFIRQTDVSRIELSSGEYITLYELESAVAQSSTLESHLKSMLGVISHASARNSIRDNLSKLLEHLAKDGYVVLANKDSGTYQVTGKIEQLYSVLQFLDEQKVIPDSEVDDLDEPEDDLVEQAQGNADKESLL